MSYTGSGLGAGRSEERIEQRIMFGRDGLIYARSGKVEYGQGIRTGFAMIVAQELQVPIDRVVVELGETARVPWDMGTFGSMSIAVDGKRLRAAAIYARRLLIERASAQFDVDIAALRVDNGCVVAPDGRALTYQELTAATPLAGTVPEAENAPATDTSIANAPLRLEARDIVTGQLRYPADVRLSGMVRGRIVRGPVAGSTLATLDDRAARVLPGVVAIVRDNSRVGVVAESTAQAATAASALAIRWSRPVTEPPAAPIKVVLRGDEGIGDVIAGAALTTEARYFVPHIAHAAISPSAAVADVRSDAAEIYAAIQRPFALRDDAAKLLGLSPDQVQVHPQAMGGMFGRGAMHDCAMDAVWLSMAAGCPVLVQWSREQEFLWSPHRPVLDAELHGALDATGEIIGWRYIAHTNFHTYGGDAGPPGLLEMTSGRNAVPPYQIRHMEVRLEVVPGEVRTGAFRSLAAAPNVFASESFIDELAHLSGQDPIAFRLRHTRDPRLVRVLETVRERSGWGKRSSSGRRGLGIACAIYHGTYVAEVAEVSVTADWQVRLEKVWAAVDPGRLVHPDGARNQIEGGIQQAASWTLLEELVQHDGEVMMTTFKDYPIARFQDAPQNIEVVFTAESGADSTGIGEPGSVPTAAAIANALFAACGVRARRLPLKQAIFAAAHAGAGR